VIGEEEGESVSVDLARTDEALDVIGWRAERLVAAGYDEGTALALALDASVDLHRAVDLVHRGCPPETALRILR
jgi:hypothetical protein